MKYQFFRCAGTALLTMALLLAAGPFPAPQTACAGSTASTPPQAEDATEIEPAAMDALKEMGAYLQTLVSFTVRSEISMDEVLISGQKIMVDGTEELTAQRPNRLRGFRKIDERRLDVQFFYDGQTFTLLGNTNKYYASFAAPDTIGKLLEIAERRYNITIPLRDLFVWGTDSSREKDIQSAIYIDSTRIDGVPCKHFAFRQAEVDWQIWIEADQTPLPRKLVITSKTEEGHPQYAASMRWDLAPKIETDTFTFLPPGDARKITFQVFKEKTESTK